MNLEKKIESVLFFKNEPITLSELSKLTGSDQSKVKEAIESLQNFYKERGIVLVSEGEKVGFGTSPELSSLIEDMQKEEYSRDLGRAGLETLAIILYKGPITRRDIDYIRGVNSSFIIRTLMVRGLIERTESKERGYSYKATLDLLKHLGISSLKDLPEFETAFKKVGEFLETQEKENGGGE